MSATNSGLYQQLLEYSIDGPQAVAFPFAQRLAEENRWDRVYAERVLLEYKKFIYMAVSGNGIVTPSPAVDQAWHLHLAYTKSYWKEMCGELLGQPLHHHPTTGGSSEHQKHRQQYEATLQTYQKLFGTVPPADIWPPVDIRFSAKADGVWVIPDDVLIIPRRRLYAVGQVVVLAMLLLLPLGCAGDWNPFHLQTSQYFLFYLPAIVLSLIWAWYYRCVAGGGYDVDESTLSWNKIAYLSGKERLTTAAIARLVETDRIQIDPLNTQQLITVIDKPKPTDAVEKAVYRSMPLQRNDQAALQALNKSTEAAMAEAVQEMRDEGLLNSPAQAWQVALISILPLLCCVLLLGLPRIITGLDRGKPVDFIIMFTIAAAVAVVILLVKRPVLTPRGRAVLQKLKQRHQGASKAIPTANPASSNDGLAMSVALFGTAALAGTTWASLHSWYPKPVSSSSSGCGTSGCTTSGCGGGGDGGGGGGCGGCGGGGD